MGRAYELTSISCLIHRRASLRNKPYIDVCIGVIAFYNDLGLGYWKDQIDGEYRLRREV